MTTKAQLEKRYIVLKMSDVRQLSSRDRAGLDRICNKLAAFRRRRGANPDLPCIVVERDWPEYQPTLDTILARVDRENESAG